MHEFRESYSQTECHMELTRLFPQGFSGPDVRNEVPFEKIIDISDDDPETAKRNVRELVGRCVWDIFSNQHEVIAPDGRPIDLGSFRAAGEFLAVYSNRQTGRREFDYMSFYLGTSAPWARAEGDLSSVHELIFRRLQRRGLDWVYHFPQLYLVDFRPLREALDREGKPDWLDNSPSEALTKEEKDRQRDEEIAEFRQRLEEGRNEDIAEALSRPSPPIVEAYRNVYGRFPQGWPPTRGVGKIS